MNKPLRYRGQLRDQATMKRLDEGFERSINSASPAYTAAPTMAPKNNREAPK